MKNTPKTTQEELRIANDIEASICDWNSPKQLAMPMKETCILLARKQIKAQQSLLDRVNLEIIGETEVALNRPKAATRNELKREQRKKLEEVRSNL